MSGAFPNAAAFLATALPWPPPDSNTFFINIHRKRPVTNDAGQQVLDGQGRPCWMFPGRACRTVAEAINFLEFVERRETADTYVCMSGQLPGEVKHNKRGRPYYRASRSADSAQYMKGLWLDVDVKADPNKGYASTAEAAEKFTSIRRAVGLPVPTMCIASGSGGFHAHWCFDTNVEPSVWEPLALALVEAFIEKGFKGDTGCTTDAARLLRIPDTWNHKQAEAGTGPKTPVGILSRSGLVAPVSLYQQILQPWIGRTAPRLRQAPTLLLQGQMPAILQSVPADELLAGIEIRPTPSIGDVAQVCPFVLRSLKTGGAENNNPLWLATTNIALFCTEGAEAAHWMSQGHATYNKDDTDTLIVRQTAQKQRKLGWPQCRSIAAQGAPECRTCPHLQKDKSPFNAVAIETPVVLDVAPPPTSKAINLGPIPKGYGWGPNGIVLVERIEEDGNITKEPLTLSPILDAWIQDQPAVVNFTTVVAGVVGHVDALTRQIKMAQSLIHDASQLGKSLADQGMLVNPTRLMEFRTFMASYSELLRRNRNNVVQSAPFGWLKENGQTQGFIYNRTVYGAVGERPASNPDPALERQYSPVGSIDPWMAASKMVTDQRRPEFDAILASAFAGPLVGCVGQTGLLMSTYSPESGIGKSTAIKVAQAVWGHPVRAVHSLSDTQNSVIKKMGDIRSLPMYWDELKTDADHAKFVSLAFQLAQGKEKSRLSSDTSYREPGTWETILVSASNDSLINYIAGKTRTTSAGISRIFEFRVTPPKQGRIDMTQAQQITASLNDNYGNAGLVYAKFLGREHVKIQQDATKLLLELEKTLASVTEERFWLSLVAVILLGAHYANKLKLTNIDETALRTFMLDQFHEMRGERTAAPVDITKKVVLVDHLARYLNDKRMSHTIATNYIWKLGSRPPVHPQPAGIQMKSDPGGRLVSVHVHVGVDNRENRLMKAPFIEWLQKHEISDRLLLQELKRQLGATEARGRLAVGTPFQTESELVLDIDGSKLGGS